MKKSPFSSPRLVSSVAVAAVVLGSFFASTLSAQTASPTPSVAAATASPAAAAVSPAAKEDLVATLKTAGNFKTFLKAAEAAGLLETLQKPGPHTVFAPTDAAFTKLPAGTLDDLLKPENKAKLVTLISYHIASGKLTATDLTKTDEVKTLEGTELDVDTGADGKTIEVDMAKVLGSDVDATNGVIHAIDTVLQP